MRNAIAFERGSWMGGFIGLIFWGCFLFFIINNLNRYNKKQKRNTAVAPNRQNSSWSTENQQNWQMSQSTASRQSSGKASAQDWVEQRESQAELKRRLQAKYGDRKSETVQPEKPDILARAARNVAEDFEDSEIQTYVRKQAESAIGQKKREQPIGAAVHIPEAMETQPVTAGNMQTELGHIYDIPQNLELLQESELMQMVSDLMAKGVETSLEFERDFISEGMDMINRSF